MPRPAPRLQLLLSLLLPAGCAPGAISWAEGRDDLRTALFIDESEPDRARTTLVLSTGRFACDFPSFEDPREQSVALAALTTGACREDARHLVLHLYGAPGIDEGTYPLPVGDQVPEQAGRGANALYIGIEEARSQRFDGLVPVYEPTEVTFYRSEGDPGEVEVTSLGDGSLSGRFDLPEVDVSGHFTAEVCPPDAPLFALIASAPVAACSFGGP